MDRAVRKQLFEHCVLYRKMDLLASKNSLPHFHKKSFGLYKNLHKKSDCKFCWEDGPLLGKIAKSIEYDTLGYIAGKIPDETEKQWLDWPFGKLYLVACRNNCYFCCRDGTILPTPK